MTDLSICVPARNEQFLARTVQDLIDRCEGDTEIIAVLDGAWADPAIPVHDRVSVIYNPEPVGQRAACNQAARVAQGRWLMKVDAHCSFDQGFDVKLLEGAEDDWTITPTMFNLHAFDWVCPNGHRRYQGPSGPCAECGRDTEQDILWFAKPSPETTSMRFDRDLRFQYWGGYKERQGDGPWVETMSLIGACFALTRDRWVDLDICDENHGSWGQQGTEVACKTWLSGGRLMLSRRTWFAHMFRTQGGDFGHPYHLRGSDVDHARAYSRALWLDGGWDKAIHPLSWLIEKFAPVPDWGDERKGIVYYTDNQAPVRLAKQVQKQLRAADLPIVSVSMKPMPHFGQNIHLPGERGPSQMFKQILAGLEASEAEYVFLCEHDVLYHPSHFQFVPENPSLFYYNTNVWKVRDDGFAVRVDDCRQTSGLCAHRALLVEHYRKRVELVERVGYTRRMGFEPGTHTRTERVDDYGSDVWQSDYPNLDIRHGQNLTPSRWSPGEFRDKRYAEGWVESRVEALPGWAGVEVLVAA